MPRKLSMLERFSTKVELGPTPSDCWGWLGCKSERGYGKVLAVDRSRPLLAHRVAWELFRGIIPVGKSVLHACDNPACTNINHLWLGDQRENMRDCAAKRRLAQQRRTHCPAGHLLDGDNLMTCPSLNGRRSCRACHNVRA